MAPIDRKRLIGATFGRLVVHRIFPSRRHRNRSRAICSCSCGTRKTFWLENVIRGRSRSCGCLQSEITSDFNRAAVQHGMCNTPEYRSWNAMMMRCTNRHNASWRYYGGRGIKISKRWTKFSRFLSDMGRRPPNTTLDRIDVNGNYTARNCRWAAPSLQAGNRRNRHVVTIDSDTKTVTEWSRIVGISDSAFLKRIRNGLVGRQLLLPPMQRIAMANRPDVDRAYHA